MPRPSLRELDQIDPAIIAEFRKTKQSMAIPEYLQRYIIHLDRAVQIMRYCGDTYKSVRQLMDEFQDEGMSFRDAERKISDAMNYFHLNNQVKNEAWDQYYADRFEEMADDNKKLGDLKEARLCLEKAHELRTRRDENAINPEDLKIKDQIISPDMSPERLGLKERNLRKMWLDTNTFLEELDLETVHKERILKEAAEVLDVDYEEVSGN
jgi:hypothetical protein